MLKEDHGIIMIVLTAILSVLGVVLLAILDMNSTDYVPERIKSFCQATHEVYGSSYGECINQYRAHKGTK